jgi:hypothetical protein
MPLVFVHGVNTRCGESVEEKRVFDNRVTLLKEQFGGAFSGRVSAATGLRVFTPYWGDLGVTFARNLASLPHSAIQTLAIAQPASGELINATAAKLDAELVRLPELRNSPLLTVARARMLPAAVDLLIAGSACAPVPADFAASIAGALPDAARFAAAAEAYAAANPSPAWLSEIDNDSAFVTKLQAEVAKLAAQPTSIAAAGPAIQSLSITSGLKTWLQNGASALNRTVGSVADSVKGTTGEVATNTARAAFLGLSGFVRPTASAFIGRFIGDVFTYLDGRQQIVERVLADIKNAQAACREGDQELYLVGHSFGGIILYDILTAFPAENLHCQLYVTVGSQVALFAEIGRLAAKNEIDAAFARSATAEVPRPARAERWLNIFDLTDYVGFGTAGVFSGARDYQFATDALPLLSHTAYFDTPRFFARLRERVGEVFAEGTGP